MDNTQNNEHQPMTIETAMDLAMEWFNRTSKKEILQWFEQSRMANHQDPSDIICPIDGGLVDDWAVQVIYDRADWELSQSING